MYCLRYSPTLVKAAKNRTMAAQPPGKRPAEQSIFVHKLHASLMTFKLHPRGNFNILSSPRIMKCCTREVLDNSKRARSGGPRRPKRLRKQPRNELRAAFSATSPEAKMYHVAPQSIGFKGTSIWGQSH